MVEVSREGRRRARARARQNRDTSRGHFFDRIFELPFGTIPGGGTQTVVQPFTSMGGRHVRVVAMRGSFRQNSAVAGIELANIRLRLVLNGQSDFAGGDEDNATSFAMLFADQDDPWYWYASPPRMRTGDLLAATVTYKPSGEGVPSIIPELALRIMDDALWERLYVADALDAEGY